MTNIPKTIYLQIGNDCPDGEDFNKLYGVTWCAERINENDIEYVLKEQIKELILEAYYAGFNQAHYSHMHPEICEPKECESAGKEYLAKKEKSIEYVLKENEEETEKGLEERTERNIVLIDAFCEHLKSENIIIPESLVLSFFNA